MQIGHSVRIAALPEHRDRGPTDMHQVGQGNRGWNAIPARTRPHGLAGAQLLPQQQTRRCIPHSSLLPLSPSSPSTIAIKVNHMHALKYDNK